MAVSQISCPHCQSAINVYDEYLGKVLQCPACGKTFLYSEDLQYSTPFAGTALPPEMQARAVRELNVVNTVRWDREVFREPPPGFTTALDKYADFSGRASRAEYWLYMIYLWGVQLAAVVVITVLFLLFPLVGMIFMTVAIFGSLYFVIPSIAVSVRRLHDLNLSGWCFLLCLIPFIGGLTMTVFSCLPSCKEVNRWGGNPNQDRKDEFWPCLVGIFLWFVLPWLIFPLMLLILV